MTGTDPSPDDGAINRHRYSRASGFRSGLTCALRFRALGCTETALPSGRLGVPQFALDALNNEHVSSRRTSAKRLRLLIFGRIVKRLKPLHGRKLDDNNS